MIRIGWLLVAVAMSVCPPPVFAQTPPGADPGDQAERLARLAPRIDTRDTKQNMWRGLLDMVVRPGMKDPQWRGKIEALLGRRIDWTVLPVRDATLGQRLKSVIERHLQALE